MLDIIVISFFAILINYNYWDETYELVILKRKWHRNFLFFLVVFPMLLLLINNLARFIMF